MEVITKLEGTYNKIVVGRSRKPKIGRKEME
jgi:hypothetical protein